MTDNKIEFTCGIFIEAQPEIIFSFLTEQDKAAQWYGEVTDIDGRSGGNFMIETNSGMRCSGEFLEVIPHEKIVFTWGGVMDLKSGATTVEITLKPENGGTQLTLRHYNIPTQEAADSFGHGWPNNALPLLKLVSEGGTTEKRCFSSGSDCDSVASK
jgi:uncharacterized protein YndB with AHSA1/START domain